MTIPFATGTYTLLRGNAVDVYGDDADTATAVSGYAAMVGAVVEQASDTSGRVTGMPRTIRTHTGRFPAAAPIRPDDRIRDNHTGDTYVVGRIQRIANPVTGTTTRVDLVIAD